MMNLSILSYISVVMGAVAVSIMKPVSSSILIQGRRELQTVNTNPPYFTTTNLGTKNNYDVTLGNPLRGLAGDGYNNDAFIKSKIKFSLEVFYYPFSKVVVGKNQYDWTAFDTMLNKIKSRNNHAIPRFYIDYPGQALALPQYLIDTVKFYTGGYSSKSPYYDDPNMQAAMKDFVFALAARYDGDQRIAMIQAGLLGYWAEWHSGDITSIILPDSVSVQVLQWFDDAFSKTPIQIRYPRKDAYARNFGFHDDSFTWSTLDGAYNGGVYTSWFTEPQFRKLNMTDFWKRAPMGGEVRPENVKIVFESTYPTGTLNKQDFYSCSQLTHSTYNKVGGVIGDYFISQSEADKANWNSARMGYSFQVTSVAVRKSMTDPTKVDIDVVVENNGIAPFYYPLDMILNCPGIALPHRIGGVEAVLDKSTSKTLQYRNVPATSLCLNDLSFTLDSKMIFPGRPIKFAQGDGTVRVNVPLPPNTPVTPTAPVARPTQTPTRAPATVPVSVPVAVPTLVGTPINTVPTSTSNSIVQSFVLKDVGTKKEYPLTDFMTVDLAQIGTKSLTIVASTTSTTNIRVEFTWTDTTGAAQIRVENTAPWSMGGDIGTLFGSVSYLGIPGTKAVTATAYSTSTGAVVGSRTIRFTVVDGTVPTTPVLVAPAPTTPVVAPSSPVKVPSSTLESSPFTSFVLKDVGTFKEYLLSSGMSIQLSVIGSSPLTLIANTASNSNIRVEFSWTEEDGVPRKTVENTAPWSMGGDITGTFFWPVPFLTRTGPKSITVAIISTTTQATIATNILNFNVV